MKEEVKFNVLETMKAVALFSNQSKLNPILFEVLGNQLSLLNEHFELSSVQSMLLSNAVVNENYNRTSWGPIFHFFDLDNLGSIKYDSDIQVLYGKRYLFDTDQEFSTSIYDRYFAINPKLHEAIINNKKMDLSPPRDLSLIGFLEEFIDRGVLPTHEFKLRQQSFLDYYDKFPLVHWMAEMDLSLSEKYYLIVSIWHGLKDMENLQKIQNVLDDYFETISKCIECIQDIITGRSKLIKNNLIILVENYTGHTRLSKEVIDFLKEKEDIVLYVNDY